MFYLNTLKNLLLPNFVTKIPYLGSHINENDDVEKSSGPKCNGIVPEFKFHDEFAPRSVQIITKTIATDIEHDSGQWTPKK